MKKYLLIIISLVCAVTGAWADSGVFGASQTSTWEVSDGVLTLTFNNVNDKPLKKYTPEWGGEAWEIVCDLEGITKVVVRTASGVALSGTAGWESPLHVLNSNYKTIPVLDLSEANFVYEIIDENTKGLKMSANDGTFSNVIVPSEFSSMFAGFRITGLWSNDEIAINKYSASGTTVKASLNKTDALTALANIKSDATTLKIMNEVGAIDLSSVLVSENTLDLTGVTTGSNGSNGITVVSGVKVVCLSDEVKSRITGTENIIVVNPVISCVASELSVKLTNLSTNGVSPTSVTITSGELSATDITSLNIEGLTRINLQDATIASGANINTLTIPSTLEALTLPKSATPESSIDATLLANVKAASSLKYVYAPYSGTQNKDQAVADYVWVNKAGGLWQAMENEPRLLTAVYVKVASDVTNGVGVRLNEKDAKFGDHSILKTVSGENYPWQYIDLSGTFFGVDATNAYTAPHDGSYRIILPDNLTGDHMAIFASKPVTDITGDSPDRGYRGSIAAVYSYKGTTLNLMEITDESYHTNALADSRIVRSGTQEVKVISGSYDGTTFSKFGPNLLAALNGAASSITKATVAVGNGFVTTGDAAISSATTFSFDNDNLTNLDLSYTNNANVTINVSGCANLANFQMNEATVAAVDAHGISSLATVSLGHTTVGGDVNLSGSNLATDLEVDLANIAGTLNISGTSATSYDLTQLTAKSVNASNTNSLTSLNINGIALNGMTGSGTDAITSDNISNRIGTVEVTRTGGDYSGLTITTASSTLFSTDRIVPKLSDISDDSKKYTLTAIEPSVIEITAAGSSLSTTVPNAVTAYNNSQSPVESNTVANVQILHVTGTLTSEDITYIKNNLTALHLLDLSGCTFAEGVGVSNIISESIPTSVAIVLPGTNNSEESTIADVNSLQDANYECVAYYTSKTEGSYRMNVYGYNGTVGNLKSNSPALIDATTGISFLPRYASTDVSDQHNYPSATPSLLTALATLPAYSINMTWLNISNLGTDFSGLNSATHYLVIPQNTTAATTTRNGIVYNNDFTDESASGVTNYRYSDDIYAVSTYKGTASPYATQAYFGGESYQYGSGYGQIDKTANLTYVRKEGKFGDVYNYMSSNLKNADILSIAGTIDNDDFASSALGAITNPYLDLTHADITMSGEKAVNWSSYANSTVKNIALPYNYDGDADTKSTLSDLTALGLSKTNCGSLKGVSTLVKTDISIPSTTSKKSELIYLSFEERGVGDAIMLHHALNLIDRAYCITSLTVGGPVCAQDLSNDSKGIDSDGHLITTVDANNMMTVSGSGTSGSLSGYSGIIEAFDLSQATLPTYTEITSAQQSYAFDNSTHAYATSTSGSFSFQNDLCFSKLGIASDQFITVSYILPTDESVWRLPTDALNNVHGLTELCLPRNYQYIGNGAFLDTYLTHITTTDEDGNIVDNGDHSYTLSDNLKELGDNPGSGNMLNESQTVFPQNREVYDVYVLATDVPKCYAGVFPANVLYGWGGFQPDPFPYCRDKYINGSNWFCVLRYPYQGSMSDAVYQEMEKKYTDIYKIYTKKEQTGAVDANGKEIAWPTFTELQRVSSQALTGKVWYDWETAYNGSQEVNTSSSYSSEGYTKAYEVDASKHYDFNDYKGWHQFVLTQATFVTTNKQNATEREYVEGGWYTFCIPFDLTKNEVIEMLGIPASNENYTYKYNNVVVETAMLPDIRTLKQVERKPGSTNLITMSLTDNLVEGGTCRYWNVSNDDSEPTSDYADCEGDIAIKGGYPYYIKPYLLKDETVNNLGLYIMTRYADKFKQTASCSRYRITQEYLGSAETPEAEQLGTLQFAKPYEEHKIWAKYDDDDDKTAAYESHYGTDKKYYYTFVGQFWDQPLPHYCYYTLEGTGSWYRFTRFDNTTASYRWRPYKCVILCTPEDDTDTHPTSGKFRKNSGVEGEEFSHYPTVEEGTSDLLKTTLKLVFMNGIDDYNFVNSARECMFIFDDEIMGVSGGDSATSINRLDGVDILPVGSKVYNLAGQLVGNSLEGLSKGVYFVSGKKIVVK